MRTLPARFPAFGEASWWNTPPSFSSASTPRQFPHLKPAVYAALDCIRGPRSFPGPGAPDILYLAAAMYIDRNYYETIQASVIIVEDD